MMGRMVHTTSLRLIALALATVLTIVAATPAKAEAVDPLTIVALVGLAAAGIVLIAYLVVANVAGKRRADTGRVIWMACTGDGCAAVPAETVAAIADPAVALSERQGP
jgi:hypothetical protein